MTNKRITIVPKKYRQLKPGELILSCDFYMSAIGYLERARSVGLRVEKNDAAIHYRLRNQFKGYRVLRIGETVRKGDFYFKGALRPLGVMPAGYGKVRSTAATTVFLRKLKRKPRAKVKATSPTKFRVSVKDGFSTLLGKHRGICNNVFVCCSALEEFTRRKLRKNWEDKSTFRLTLSSQPFDKAFEVKLRPHVAYPVGERFEWFDGVDGWNWRAIFPDMCKMLNRLGCTDKVYVLSERIK